VRLINISAGGFHAAGGVDVRIGDLVWIDLPGLGYVRSQVRWRQDDLFGGAFLATSDLRLRFINGLPDTGIRRQAA
jgi:hypothetical protein